MKPDATALAQAIETLDAQARIAKRAEAASRRQARELRRTIDELRRACRELGIELVTQTGGHSERRDS